MTRSGVPGAVTLRFFLCQCTHSLLCYLFPAVLIGKEIRIVLEAESSGLPRPPMESDENLIGKPEMLLSHVLGQ